MPPIRTSHDLSDTIATRGAEGRHGPSRSGYSYLFPHRARRPEAGRLRGTTDSGTIQRLKEFEKSCRLPFSRIALNGLTMRLPAAYTYFGQFLNHDISAPVGEPQVEVHRIPPIGIVGTADPGGLADGRRASIGAILRHFANEHPRPLTLASLYGDGPGSDDPEVRALYQPDGRRFVLGKTGVTPDEEFEVRLIDPASVDHVTDAPDLPRAGRVPLIADRRNDGNLILSQLHLALMLFHNRTVEALEAQPTRPEKVFETARHLVTLTYQWLVLNDFLPALLSRSVLARPLSEWVPRKLPPGTVPMEFTTAAFRFGHSMIGRVYDFNANFGQGGRISTEGATLRELFAFTSHGNMGEPDGPPRPLPDHWVIDWNRLTRVPAAGAAGVPGTSERIDLDFAPDMLTSAGDATIAEHGSILFRNLLRGFHRRIPFGQVLAEECGVGVLSAAQISAAMPRHRSPSGAYHDPAAAAEALGLLRQTPAWLYFLCEAQVIEGGDRVGPTASQIIVDTIISLLRNDATSVLGHEGGTWHPRDHPLRDPDGKPLTTLRSLLLCATARP